VEVYDKPTKSVVSSITGSYIGISEKRVNEQMFLLKNNSSFDIKKKDNTLIGTHTITSGNGVTLPTGNPIAINDWDSGLAFIYPNSSGNQLLLTDENGIANRKYIYSSDDSKYIEDIAWDYNSNFVALNPYGQIYTINTTTGAETLLYQFDDYSTNKSSSKKRYTSLIVYDKNASYYIGVLRDSSDIVFVDYGSLEIVSKSETGMSNLLAISYSNYSDNTFALLSSKTLQITLNTCRIDVLQIKDTLSNGLVTISDENGMQYKLAITQSSVTRDPNGNEARYEITIDGNIAYTGIGFGNAWVKNSRSI
jgi:hypothetical protein